MRNVFPEMYVKKAHSQSSCSFLWFPVFASRVTRCCLKKLVQFFYANILAGIVALDFEKNQNKRYFIELQIYLFDNRASLTLKGLKLPLRPPKKYFYHSKMLQNIAQHLIFALMR